MTRIRGIRPQLCLTAHAKEAQVKDNKRGKAPQPKQACMHRNCAVNPLPLFTPLSTRPYPHKCMQKHTCRHVRMHLQQKHVMNFALPS